MDQRDLGYISSTVGNRNDRIGIRVMYLCPNVSTGIARPAAISNCRWKIHMSQALRHARAAGVPEGTQEPPSHGKRLRMCNKLFLILDWPNPSTTSWRSGTTHTPPPAVCAKRLFFVTWQPRVWKKWVQPPAKYRRQGRTGLPASKKEGRKLQIFNLAACWWGLPREDMAHNLICFAT